MSRKKYPNLSKYLNRRPLRKNSLARYLGMSVAELNSKLRARDNDFTGQEIRRISRYAALPAEHLFAKDMKGDFNT